MNTLKYGVTALFLSITSFTGANAAIIEAHTANCGGFGTCDDSSFQTAATAIPLTFIDFVGTTGTSTGADGFADSLGTSFSPDVTFTSLTSATFGGIDSARVNHDGEIGPDGGWDGILRMDFASAVTAVGFGTVELSGVLEAIRLYDAGGSLLFDRGAISSSTFDYAGFIATGGDSIGAVELEGDFFAIQNISFGGESTSVVPLPAAGWMILSGLAGLGLIGRRRRIS